MADIEHEGIIDQKDIDSFMACEKIQLFEKTSAKTGESVEKAFEKLLKKLLTKPISKTFHSGKVENEY